MRTSIKRTTQQQLAKLLQEELAKQGIELDEEISNKYVDILIQIVSKQLCEKNIVQFSGFFTMELKRRGQQFTIHRSEHHNGGKDCRVVNRYRPKIKINLSHTFEKYITDNIPPEETND